MADCPRYTLAHGPAFARILKRLNHRDAGIREELNRAIEKILKNPTLGKPLKNVLHNFRRIHVMGSFVLLYEIDACVVRLVDFDHHDHIYKKYS